MSEDKERFLSRWSRLKHEASVPEKKEDETPAPVLPELDKLTPQSDFTGFMHPKVADALRRVALKKLFSDPHFNVADPYEAYSGDWTGGEPISEEMLAQLNQARRLIFDAKEENKQEEPTQVAAAAPADEEPKEAKDDEPGRQDT